MSDYLRYIPGLGFVDSMIRLGKAGAKSNVISENIPAIGQAVDAVKNTAQGLTQSQNIYNNVPGLKPAVDASRSFFSQGKPEPKSKKSLPENRYRDRESTGITRMGGVTYDLSIPHHRELYNAAVKQNQDAIPDNQKGDIRGGGGLKPDGKTHDLPPRQSPQVAPENQQGRQSGKLSSAGFAEANGLLERLGISTVQYGGFESTRLPEAGQTPNITNDQFIMQAQDGGYLDGFKGGTNDDAILYAQDKGFQPVAVKQVEGTDKIPQNGTVKATDGVRPESKQQQLGTNARYSTEFMKDRPDMPAQYNQGMVGLRAAEASKGLLYASGKYWKSNPLAGQDGEKDFIEIDKAEWNTIKRNDQTPQQFKDQKVGEVKDAVTYTDTDNKYEVTADQTPVTKTPVEAYKGTQAPLQSVDGVSMTDKIDVRYQDTDRTGRYNKFR